MNRYILAMVLLLGGIFISHSQELATEVTETDILEAYPDYIREKYDDRIKAINENASSDRIRVYSVITIASLWAPGQVVKVSFNGGNKFLHKRIADAAVDWSKYGNIKLDFGFNTSTGEYRKWNKNDKTYTSEIRISFEGGANGGYWSLVGNDSIDPAVILPNQPSMNFEGFDRVLPSDYAATVLHEFGHSLGFQHEHQNPIEGCDSEFRWEDDSSDPINKPGIYTLLAKPPNNWSRAKVDYNLRQLKDSNAYLSSYHDPYSIMHYSFPAVFCINGNASPCCVPENRILSEQDKQGTRQAYPRERNLTGPILDVRNDMIDNLMLEDFTSDTNKILRNKTIILESIQSK